MVLAEKCSWSPEALQPFSLIAMTVLRPCEPEPAVRVVGR